MPTPKERIESEFQRAALNPQFAALSYEDQQKVRAKIAMTILNEEPSVQQLDLQGKAQLIDRVIGGRTPVLESPQAARVAAPLFAKAQAGQLDPKEVAYFSSMQGLMTNGLLANVVGRPAAKMADLLTGGAKDDGQFRWENLIDLHTGSDGDKIASYLENEVRRQGMSSVSGAYRTLGTVIGFVSDLAVFHGSWQKMSAKPVADLGKSIAQALPGRGGTWAGKVALPAFVSGTSSGTYGVMREQVLAQINSDDERKQNTFKKVANTFGQWALLDYAINLAAGTVLPHLAGSWRRVGGKAKETNKLRSYTPKELDEAIDRVIDGTITDEMLYQLDESSRRFLQGQADIRKAAGRLDRSVRLRPYDDLVLEGNAAGMTVHYDTASGNYLVYSPAEGGVAVAQFDDMISAKREVSRGLLSKYEGLSSEGQREFAKLHKNSLQYALSERMIDGGLDPLKVKGYVSPKQADELSKLRAKRAKDFISPLDRPYVGRGEAEAMMKTFGNTGYVKVIKAKLPKEALARVGKGDDLFASGRTIKIVATEDGDEVLAMVRNPAPPEAVAKATRHAQKAAAAGGPETATTLRNMYLMESGFDGIIEGPDSIQMFYPDKLKLIAEKFNPHLGKIGTAAGLIDESEQSVQSTIARQFKATVSAEQFARNKKLVGAVASNLKGDIDVDELGKLSKIVLADKGIDPSKVTIKLSSKADAIDSVEDAVAYARINKQTGTVEIEVPKRITTPAKQKQLIKELFDPNEGEFKNIIDTLGDSGKGKKLVYPKLTKKSEAVYRSPFTSAAATEKWLRSSVEDIAKGTFNKTARGYQVKLPGRNPIEAASLDEIVDRVMLETTDFAYLKFDMARRGYRLTKSGDTFTVRGKGLEQPITGKSVNEIANKLNYRPQKISNRFAPKVSFISSEAVEVQFENGIAIGDRKGIRKLLNNFEDMDYIANLKKIGNYDSGEVYITPAGAYEVHMPEFGIIEKFDTAQAANRFIRHNYKEFGSLKRIAERKGLQMWFDQGGIKLSDGTSSYTAKNKDEVLRIFKEYPDSSGATEILADGVDEETLNAVDKVLRRFDDAHIPVQDGPPVRPYGSLYEKEGAPLQSMGASGEIRALFDNMDHWTEVTMKKMGQTDVLTKYRNLTVTRRMAKSASDKAEEAVKKIFTKSDGKMLPLERRKAIFRHAGAQTPEEELDALEMFGELTSGEQAIVGRLRKLLGEVEGEATTGLAGIFGIEPGKFIKNYMPRIMDWSVRNASEVAKMTTAEELVDAAMKSVYGTGAPRKLKAFFKNMRTSEVLEFAAVDDPVRALQHYIRVGYRQHYMGRAWEELYDVLAKSGVDNGVIQRFNRYREAVMGLHSNEGQRVARRIGEDLGRKLGIKNGGNAVDAYFSMNYLANMGYRPWLALRNTYQVFTTLAPRFGNSWVDDAIGKARTLSKEEYSFLREIGVLRGEPPIVNTILDAESTLGKVTHKALGMFKSSDEYTRAVAYYTAAGRFDFALGKWRKGGIKNIDDFLVEAGVTKMDSETIHRVRTLVEKGGDESIDAAKTYFGTKVSNETMFEYVKEQAPTLYTGSFFGKLFGQYGTYAAGYRANIVRGLSNGSFGDKAAFVARFLGNQSALFAAFTALGINARNFIPGAPALFGGGPQFEVGIALLQGMGSGYQARQARSQLLRKFSPVGYTRSRGFYANYPEMLPGSIQYRYATKALEYLDQGDYWRAFLAATTTPVTDPKQ